MADYRVAVANNRHATASVAPADDDHPRKSGGGCCAPPSNVPPEVAAQYPAGFGWWSMPVPRKSLKALRTPLKRFPWREDSLHNFAGLTFHEAPAAEAAKFMYEATKVDGVWEKLPEKLRGVYWMKGNGVAEELTSMQYGLYLPEKRLVLVPFAPAMWGWPAGKPDQAPFGGGIYGGELMYISAEVLLDDAAQREANTNWLCFSYAWSDDSFSHATLGAQFGALDQHDGVKVACITGFFDLRELPSPLGPGALWKRGIRWGVGHARCIPFGSYQLTKVIDAYGAPLEPHHSEFVAYMGDVPIFMWTGFGDD